jgi:hypothetical protein
MPARFASGRLIQLLESPIFLEQLTKLTYFVSSGKTLITKDRVPDFTPEARFLWQIQAKL